MTFAYNGRQAVHWQSAGHGPPLVLIHGLGGDTSFFASDVPILAQAHRVITIDLRGSGRTPAASGGHLIDDLADDVVAVLDAAEIPRAHLLGFSMGGQVALSFAARYPARLDRLVLAGACAVLNAQIRMFVDAVLDVWEAGATARQMFDLISPWLFAPAFVADPAHADFFVLPEDDPDEQSLSAWRNLYIAQRQFDGRPLLRSVVASTLVITGRHDRFANDDDTQLLAHAIPDARLHIVDRAGHLINIDAPDEFHQTVIDHLRDGRGAEAAARLP